MSKHPIQILKGYLTNPIIEEVQTDNKGHSFLYPQPLWDIARSSENNSVNQTISSKSAGRNLEESWNLWASILILKHMPSKWLANSPVMKLQTETRNWKHNSYNGRIASFLVTIYSVNLLYLSNSIGYLD